MSTAGAWKYRPLSAGRKGVINTWAGPIRTEIYAESLKKLCNNTRDNLDRLTAQISKLDPCLEYGIEHWHPESRPSSVTDPNSNLDAENVGPLTKIVIGHDNFGLAAGWFLDYVKVRRLIPEEEVMKSVRAAKKRLKEKQKINDKIVDKPDDVDKKLAKLAMRDKNRKSERGYDDSDENDEGTGDKRYRKLKHDERSLLSGSRRSLSRTLSYISEEEEDEEEDDKSDEYYRRPSSGRDRQQLSSERFVVSDDEDDKYRNKMKSVSKDARKTPPEKRKYRSRSASAIKLEKEAEEEKDAGTSLRVPLYEVYSFPCHQWLAKDEGDGLTVRELEAAKKTTHYRD